MKMRVLRKLRIAELGGDIMLCKVHIIMRFRYVPVRIHKLFRFILKQIKQEVKDLWHISELR